MIRTATLSDIASIVEFGSSFVEQLPGPPRRPNDAACGEYLERFLRAPTGALFVSETAARIEGFISGIVAPDPFTGEMVALKCSWLVRPDALTAGGRLLMAFEAWAKTQGATRLIVSHLDGNDKLARLFLRRDFQRTEIKYERLL